MSIGERIRNARISKGLSQSELSQKLNLGKSGERISQYEKGTRTPKVDLLQQMADVLDVNVRALMDIGYDNSESTLQALFELEEKYGTYLRKEANGYSIVFENKNENDFDSLMYALDQWFHARQKLSGDEYARWQMRYPFDTKAQEEQVVQKVSKAYGKSSGKRKVNPIEKVTDLIEFVLNLYVNEMDVQIRTNYKEGWPWAALSFNTNELLLSKKNGLYAEFLQHKEEMEAYGMRIGAGSHTQGDVVYIDYYFSVQEIVSALDMIQKEHAPAISDGSFDEEEARAEYEDLYDISFERLRDIGIVQE